MNRKKIYIILAIILTPILIFWLGGFHFSKYYLIGRDVPFRRLHKIKCDDWKAMEAYAITGPVYDGFSGKECKIANDTLFIYGEPVGRPVSLVHRCFIDYELTIQSFDGTKTGSWVSK